MNILTKLFKAADNHGADSAPDHSVGDLQDLLRTAVGLMTASQQREFLASETVAEVLFAGFGGEVDAADVVADFDGFWAEKANNLSLFNVALHEDGQGFYWTRKKVTSSLYPDADDAVQAAYVYLREKKLYTGDVNFI